MIYIITYTLYFFLLKKVLFFLHNYCLLLYRGIMMRTA